MKDSVGMERTERELEGQAGIRGRKTEEGEGECVDKMKESTKRKDQIQGR